MTSTERNRLWRARRAASVTTLLCLCGRPAVRIRDGNSPVCELCAKRASGIVVMNRMKTAKLRNGGNHRSLSARMVDEFRTNGRGWGSLDALEQKLAAITGKLPVGA